MGRKQSEVYICMNAKQSLAIYELRQTTTQSIWVPNKMYMYVSVITCSHSGRSLSSGTLQEPVGTRGLGQSSLLARLLFQTSNPCLRVAQVVTL